MEPDVTVSGETPDRVDCSGTVAAGKRGAASVREPSGVPVVGVGLKSAHGESDGAGGVCVEKGDVLNFAVRFVVHVEEAEVKGMWGSFR
ncbi:MAG: hypothetical protein OXI80_22050 [Caldilineaceae bacterium]|nr:hypothetical protein [Caldilineaceae bacterium]MDE0340366.1 hypothetical protein [Caldilineaceae bacterium]